VALGALEHHKRQSKLGCSRIHEKTRYKIIKRAVDELDIS